MTNGADDRNGAVGNGAGDTFVVERPEILERTAGSDLNGA